MQSATIHGKQRGKQWEIDRMEYQKQFWLPSLIMKQRRSTMNNKIDEFIHQQSKKIGSDPI